MFKLYQLSKVHRVQYFQRARFEEHTENNPPYDVLLGLLGSEQYQKKYSGSNPTLAPTTTAPTTPASPPASVPASGCLPAANASGNTVQACVSNPTPAKNTNVIVYGRLIVNGQPIANAQMDTTWHYKSTTSSCSGTSGLDGIASCARDIGGASSGYTVKIDVVFSFNGKTYSGSTSFTTQ